MTVPYLVGDRAQRIAAVGYDYAAQPKHPVSCCNLCGGRVFAEVAHSDRYGYPATAALCLHCGLLFLDPMMDGEAYGRFYGGVYRPLVSAFHGRLIDARTVQEEQAGYAVERGDFLAPVFGSGRIRTLLDVGGSTGVVAAHMAQRFGLDATVLDPSPAELDEARGKGLRVMAGLAEDLDPGTGLFDAIMLCQTVDHLLDVAGTLAKLRSMLAPAGVFYIDVVDVATVARRGGSIRAAIKIDHPYYLTRATMAAYLARAGFRVVRQHLAADGVHVGFLCAAADPVPDALPPTGTAERFFDFIQALGSPA